MSATPTEESHDPQFRVIDMNAEVKKRLGAKYNAPEITYEFSNGRTFEERTQDAGIYENSV